MGETEFMNAEYGYNGWDDQDDLELEEVDEEDEYYADDEEDDIDE